jgi:hypothetical protein
VDIGDRTVEVEHLTASAADHPKPQSRAWRRRDALALGIALALIEVAAYVGRIDELIKGTGVVPQVNQIRWGRLLYDPAVVSGLQQCGVVLEGSAPSR